MLDGDFDWEVRANAAYGLGAMGRRDALDWLRQSHEGAADSATRHAIFDTMTLLAHPSHVPVFHEVVRSDAMIAQRLTGISALGRARHESSLPVLQAIADDPKEDPLVIRFARRALEEIAEE